MEITALLNVIAPQLSVMDNDTLNNAVALAESYRPLCLPMEKQNEAVALYAAYLLTARLEAAQIPLGITAEKEGDLSHSFGDNGLTNSSQGYLARYNKLAALCRSLGSITVGNHGG